MGTIHNLNEFIAKNGGSILDMDEDLEIQFEDKEERVAWGKVYKCDYKKMPDTALTNETEYRKWCWKAAGMMPAKRAKSHLFDDYVRERMLRATIRVPLPGLEDGAVIKDLVLRHIRTSVGWEPMVFDDEEEQEKYNDVSYKKPENRVKTKAVRDLDDPNEKKDLRYREEMWLETRADTGFGEAAVFVRINPLMAWITDVARQRTD